MTTYAKPYLKGLVALLLVTVGFLAATSVGAVEAGKQQFDLPADLAEKSLKRLAEQSGCEVLFPAEAVEGVRTRAVKGEMTTQAALDAMLAGTALVGVQNDRTGTLTVRRDPPGGSNARQGRDGEASANTSGARAKNDATGVGKISGRVSDRIAGVALEKARVSIVGSNRETWTNEFGEYHLTEVPAGTVSVQAFFTGLAVQTAAVTVASGGAVQQDFALVASGAAVGRQGAGEVLAMSEFVVRAARENNAASIAINEQRFSNTIKSVMATDAYGDIVQNNIGEFVKYLPGVDVPTDQMNPSGISLRGFGATNTAISLDGDSIVSAASGFTRGTPLQAISLNNTSRVEVYKVPTPEMSASSLGGSINLVSRNAFELSKPELRYRVYANMNSKEATLERQRGGGASGDDQAKVWRSQPDFDFSYTVPLAKTLGFSVNAVKNDQYGVARRISRTFSTVTSASNPLTAGPANPYLTSFVYNAFPVYEHRYALGLRADWKATPVDVLSFSYSGNYLQQDYEQHNFTYAVGSNPVDWGANFVHGRPGSGAARVNVTTRYVRVRNNVGRLTYRHIGTKWDVDALAGYNASHNAYRQLSMRNFEAPSGQITGATIDLDGFTEDSPGRVTVHNAAGDAIDPLILTNYNFYFSATNTVRDLDGDSASGQVNVRRKFFADLFNASVKTGLSSREEIRKRRWGSFNPVYVGPDGRANSGDEGFNRLPFSLVNWAFLDTAMPKDLPRPQFPSARKAYELFEQYPQYFDTAANRVSDYTTVVNNTENITERIDAAYLQFEASLLRNRLRLVTGVRYERTTDDGRSVLIDNNAKYRHDAAGNLILDANRRPILLTTDAFEQAVLVYQRLGGRLQKRYDGYYPSLNVSYNLSENLIARAGVARTLGRPDIGNILGATNVVQVDFDPNSTATGAALGRISTKNPNLRPWTGTGLDLRLEYYSKSGGEISGGVFRKEIKDFFNTKTFLATPEFLQTVGLSDDYVDYEVTAPYNIAGLTYITGYEVNVVQPLGTLSPRLKPFRFFANATVLRVTGANAANLLGFSPHNVNWGFSYSRRPISLTARWSLVAARHTGTAAVATYGSDAWIWQAERLRLDVSADYQLSRRLSAFISAKNIFNNPDRSYSYGSATPLYARQSGQAEYGVLLQFGIKGAY